MEYYSSHIRNLVEELSKLPGIGTKSAARLAFYLVNQPEENVRKLADTMVEARTGVRFCKKCFTLTDEELCPICRSSTRDHSTIMVVENSRDLAAYERTGRYNGVYHVLQGVISPALGIGPSDIRYKELLRRLTEEDVKELILATSSTLEGETTAMYISRAVRPTGIPVSLVASGLPAGAEPENMDEVTL